MSRVTRDTPAGRAYLDLQNQARRPTADVDALARHMSNDMETIVAWVAEIASQSAR